MRTSSFAAGLLGVLLVLSGGCRQANSSPAREASAPPPPVYHEVARVHWQGLERIGADTNSAYQAQLWGMPETQNLLRQTLDKLARFPWAGAADTNATAAAGERAALLRPLLDDLLRQESVLRVRQSSNAPLEVALAIRLDPERQAAWSTNLCAAVQPMVSEDDFVRTNLAWTLRWAGTNRLSFQPGPDWALLTLGAAATNLAAAEVIAAPAGSPPATGSLAWASADIDLRALAPLLGRNPGLALFLPRFSGRLSGDGEYMRSRAELRFPLPVPFVPEPWRIPTNFIREPLISFSAMQGFGPLLSQLPWVVRHDISPAPNQLYLWALNLTDMHTFAAVPMTNSPQLIDRLGEQLEGEWNAWITNNALGFADYSATNHGIAWSSLPMITPVVQALPSPVGDVLVGRLASPPPPGAFAPPELIAHISSATNVLYYDWEITEARVKHWVFLAQSARMAVRRAQLPPESLSMAFLKAGAPKLGNTITEVSLADPATVLLTRKSHLGLTGVELHLLADWLESPQFPRGLHTVLAQPAQVMRWRAKTRSFEPATNAPPAQRQP